MTTGETQAPLRRRRPRGRDTDLEAFHRYLFRRADRFGRLVLDRRATTEETGVSYDCQGDCLRRLLDEGRIEVIGRKHSGHLQYRVNRPPNFSS